MFVRGSTKCSPGVVDPGASDAADLAGEIKVGALNVWKWHG
jgi:hypothetical protein